MAKKRYLGILFIVASAFFFALMNLFVKLAGDLPMMQKAFFRNLVAAGVAFALLIVRPSQFRTIKGNLYPLFMRSAAGTLGIILNFTAIDSMDIADASILNKLSPFFSIIFSFFLLREKPAKFEWLAVLVAFAGAVFVVRPSMSAEVLPAVGGVLGGMSAGLAYTFVRKAGEGGASRNLIVFFFSVFSCLVILPFMIVQYKHMTWAQTGYLLAAGAAAAGGQIFITRAYTYAPAKEISVFDYSIVIFAAVLGGIFLGERPVALSFAGYAIVIAGAAINWIYHMVNEKRVSRECAAKGEMLGTQTAGMASGGHGGSSHDDGGGLCDGTADSGGVGRSGADSGDHGDDTGDKGDGGLNGQV